MSDPRDWRTLLAAAMLEGDSTQLPLRVARSRRSNSGSAERVAENIFCRLGTIGIAVGSPEPALFESSMFESSFDPAPENWTIYVPRFWIDGTVVNTVQFDIDPVRLKSVRLVIAVEGAEGPIHFSVMGTDIRTTTNTQ